MYNFLSGQIGVLLIYLAKLQVYERLLSCLNVF